MKNFIFLIVTTLALFAAVSSAVNAQEEKRLDTATTEFRQFFKRFRAAVEKNDPAAVAAMTRFPFSYGFDAGDEGTMSKVQFEKRFKDIFGSTPRKFLPERNPLFSKRGRSTYVVSTEDAAHFIFVKSGNAFKFSSYVVEL